MKKSIVIVSLMALLSTNLIAEESKKVLVAGFVNTGSSESANINEVFTKSFITFLNMLPNADLIPFDDVRKSAAKNKFWELKNFDKNAAIQFGQQLLADQIISGEYYVADEKITMKIYVYNVVDQSLKLETEKSGDAGLDIFDTIDAVIKDVTGLILGRKLTFATLNVEIQETEAPYLLYLNGKKMAEVSKTKPFSSSVFAQTEQEVTLRLKSSGSEVLFQSLKLRSKGSKSISYKPTGNLMVNVVNLREKAEVFLNGENKGPAKNNEFIKFEGLSSEQSHTLEIKSASGDTVMSSKNFKLEEGRTFAMEIDLNKNERQIYIPIALMGDSLYGGKLGVNYQFNPTLMLSLYVNIRNVSSSWIVGPQIDFTWYFLESGFKLGLNAGFSHYFVAQGNSSAYLTLHSQYNIFFLGAGARYSIQDGGVYPVLELGVRI